MRISEAGQRVVRVVILIDGLLAGS